MAALNDWCALQLTTVPKQAIWEPQHPSREERFNSHTFLARPQFSKPLSSTCPQEAVTQSPDLGFVPMRVPFETRHLDTCSNFSRPNTKRIGRARPRPCSSGLVHPGSRCALRHSRTLKDGRFGLFFYEFRVA